MKKIVKFLSLALVCAMLLPLLAVLPVKVSATEPAIGYNKTYAAASDGDLLYKVDFRGTSGVWSPTEGWDGMTASVAPDGSSVTLTPTQNVNNTIGNHRSRWGAELNTTNYQFKNSAYTVTFTVTASGAHQTVGFFPDWGTGFFLTPGQNKISAGRGNDPTAFASESTYNGTGSLTQTYAVEFREGEGAGASYPDHDVFCDVYNLYVKNGEDWILISSLNTSQRNNLWWTLDPSDLDNEVCVMFGRRYAEDQQGTVTVSDCSVYKGLICAPSSAPKTYAAANDGDLLYHADFRGTSGTWNSPASGWDGMDLADISGDGSSVSLTPHNNTGVESSNKRSRWGAELNTTNYQFKNSAYTVTFTVMASDENQTIAFYPDWGNGFYVTPGQNKISFGTGKVPNDFAPESTYNGSGSLTQTYAVEFAEGKGADASYPDNDVYCSVYNLYVKEGEDWKLIFSSSAAERSNPDHLWWTLNPSDLDNEICLMFGRKYASNQTGTVTVFDCNVYKGLICASSPAPKTYAAAQDGDLLYHADFNGTAGVWENPRSKWDAWTTADVCEDGSSVTLKPKGNKNKNRWGEMLDIEKYPFAGSSYTITFTVTASDVNQTVAFYPDCGTGFAVTPGQNKFSVGGEGDYERTISTTTYDGSGSLTQTYAVELNEGRGADASYPGNDIYCAEYRIYVKDGDAWNLIASLDSSAMRAMWWTLKPGEDEEGIALMFCRLAGKANQTGTVTVYDCNVYKGLIARTNVRTLDGAAVRLGTPTGLRFTGFVDKDYVDGLKDEYGEANVKIGMVVTPTDYLVANDLEFTMEALDACGAITGAKYLKIQAATVLDSADGTAYKINCVLSNVLEINYSRAFSAVAYVEVNGVAVAYSKYKETVNSRSIAAIAYAAYNDLNDEQTGEYQYAVDDQYSPYTSEERSVLHSFYYGGSNAVTVMSYNIEMYDEDDGWEGRTPAKAMETVMDVSPDILGLQEVDSNWNASIGTLTSDGYTRIQGDTTRNCWPELFYKTARFDELDSGYKRYSTLQSEYSGVPKNGADPSRDQLGRLFTWARLEDKETGKIVLAISTHLHYRKDKSDTASTDANAAVRQYEIRLLLAWIEAQVFDYDGVVIVGDMNAHYLESENGRGRRVIDVYRTNGFYVTRDYAAIKDDVEGTLTQNSRADRDTRYNFDYVLTRGNVITQYYTVVDEKNDNGGTSYPSDHLPVMARILVY